MKRLAEIPRVRRSAIDAATLVRAAEIVDDVRARGESAVVEHAVRLGDLSQGEPWIHDRAMLEKALASRPRAEWELLESVAQRIYAFASAQRRALSDVSIAVPGGVASHVVRAVERAGCYAPGGRFPLPSSVLMTAVTAKTAGVKTVWVASPKPTAVTLAAACVSGADALIAVGGAQAIAALAFGAGAVPAADVVVGPGNRWVTAAKQLVAGHVGIDMLAGPSELVVLADASADPRLVAADLIAQAEHDDDAVPILIALHASIADRVDGELERQLADLPTHQTARASLSQNGFTIVARDVDHAIEMANALAPEHLEVMVSSPESIVPSLHHYGAGPNHVLPTGGTARSTAGLSVYTFLRAQTQLRIDDPAAARVLAEQAAELARLEGLEGHARAADLRKP